MKALIVAALLAAMAAAPASAIGVKPLFPWLGHAKAIGTCGPPGCCARHSCLGERDPTCQNGCCTCTVR